MDWNASNDQQQSGLSLELLLMVGHFFLPFFLLLLPPREGVLGDQLGSLLAHHWCPALAYCPIAQLEQEGRKARPSQ